MITVGVDAVDVERRLVAGELICPLCGGLLAGWGHGRPRWLRGPGVERWEVRPRRARCSSCSVTHVLLPVRGLLRRADVVEVIGSALEAKATGWGHRRIADWLGRPVTTVRGWLRRFASRAAVVASVFTTLLVDLADEPDRVLPAPQVTAFADAVAAAIAASTAVVVRFSMGGVPTWWAVSAACSGGLLSPGRPPPGT